MNFLLHRHLGARDLGTSAAGVGAMLPDLWRMVDRRVRPRALDRPGRDSSPAGELLAGIQHHLVADRWFHSDAVFVDGERMASHLLRDGRISAPRTVLLAHVLWELCLDGALVVRVGIDRVLAEMGEGFDEARGGLAEVAELHHFSHFTRTSDERAAFDAKLGRIAHELRRGPWIEGYTTGKGIAALTQGVRRRVRLPPMSADDEARFADVADALLLHAETEVVRVLARPRFDLPGP